MSSGPLRRPYYVLLVILAAGTLVALALDITWAAISVTMWGKLLAVGSAALILLPITLSLRWVQPSYRRLWNRTCVALGGISGAIFAGLLLAAPTGGLGPGAAVRQNFFGGGAFPRYSIANIVPEIEQVNLGLHVMPLLDPLLARARAQRLSALTIKLYAEMERDPAFHALGSAMGGAYTDLFGGDYPAGHYYLYVPRHAASGPMPAIVFLHGSVGNFKVYTWIWAELAEELGCVIIAPSFGFGMWDRPEGVGVVRDALADAEKRVELDHRRLWLAGLSNGGLGVSQVADAIPELFRGCILISPVISNAVANSAEFQKKWSGRPMLVLTGENDERVPVSVVRSKTESLRSGGANVRFVSYPGEDHFLFFSKKKSVLNEILGWLRAQNITTPSTGVVGSGAPSAVERGRAFSG